MEQNFSNRVNQAELADIQTIAVDQTLSKEERIAEFLRQIKNPYCFRVGDVVVNVAYTEGGPTLNDCFADMLSLL